MERLYKNPFRKFVKKQSRPLQLVIEDEVEKICNAPDSGEAKKGDLSGFRIHKFKHQGREYLIAYMRDGADLIFVMIDTHENFYRGLKRYIKEASI